MRQTILGFVLLLTMGLPAIARDRATSSGRAQSVTSPPAATPAASQNRRRSVRKSPPNGPIAGADSYSIQRGGTLTVNVPGVLTNDSDPQAKPLTAILVISTTHGALTLNSNGSFTYVNDSSSATTDTFTYKANNGTVDTNLAIATITITDPPPLAAADAYTATQSTTLNVSAPGVLANDTLNGAIISRYGALSGSEQTTIGANTPTAAGGTVRLTADGSVQYTPTIGFTGSDSFKYVLANGGGTSTATVTITVQSASAIDFTVTSPGFFFQFTGVTGQNPALTLTRGRTYRFRINTSSIHPFQILDAPPGSVTNNNISNGTLTFAVPAGEGVYRYFCSIHGFGNDIFTTPQ
jgi:VCBS repeat-containing protein